MRLTLLAALALASVAVAADYTLTPNLPRLGLDVWTTHWPDGGIWVTVPGPSPGRWGDVESTYVLDDRGCASRADGGCRMCLGLGCKVVAWRQADGGWALQAR